LFDTGAPSANPLSPAALSQRNGWTQVPEDQLKHEFAGDVVFQNNRVAVVLRWGSQDELVGECRQAVKVLRSPAVHESSRH
jgi:hypothetical protein